MMLLLRLRRLIRRFGRNERAAAAIEFAIITPLFVFSTLTMSELAMRALAYQSSNSELRLVVEGAMRYGDTLDELKQFLARSGVALFDRHPGQPSDEYEPKPVGQAEGVSLLPIDGCAQEDGKVLFYRADASPCREPSRWIDVVGVRKSFGVLTSGEYIVGRTVVRVR